MNATFYGINHGKTEVAGSVSVVNGVAVPTPDIQPFLDATEVRLRDRVYTYADGDAYVEACAQLFHGSYFWCAVTPHPVGA